MRERDRFTGVVWLAGWIGGFHWPDEGPEPPQGGMAAHLTTLTERLGYAVEIRRLPDLSFTVRFRPDPAWPAMERPPAGLSYKGPNLRNILADAASSAAQLSEHLQYASLSAREYVRVLP